MSTQSTPFTVTHGFVVAPIGGTPQRRITAAGSPQAPVACASVSRLALSATVSGRRTLISAQPGALLFAAGSSETIGAHPARSRAAPVSRTAGRARRRDFIGCRLPFQIMGISGSGAAGITIGEASEREALRRIFPRLPESAATLVGPGDDAAVLAAPDGRFVVTTDMMVHG